MGEMRDAAVKMLPSTTIGMLTLFSVLCIVPLSHSLQLLGLEETYAKYPKWNACPNASISFEFRTNQPTALLLYTDDNGRYDYLQLALTKGHVRLWINFVAEENQYVDIEANTAPLNDGQWHRVEIKRNRMETILLVDGSQTSKVALGSDFDFGNDPAQNNYVYFGGVPKSYANNLNSLVLPSAFFTETFRGDLRNILYFNCSCIPVRAVMVDGMGVNSDFPEVCDVQNPCTSGCPCITVDDGPPGCECKYSRECLRDILTSYRLPMDVIKDGTVENLSGLDSVVQGGPKLIPGVRGNALLLDGRSQWLRVTGAGHRKECMGDLARCDRGYYLGMWLQFRGAGYQRGVYLSNGGHSKDSHGIAFIYSKGRLEVVFKMADGREWRVRATDVLEERWYHVAATWSQSEGLHLYVNGVRAGRLRAPTKQAAASENSRFNGFIVGRSNDNTGTDRLGQMLVDDLVFISSYKTEKEIQESGPIYHYQMTMDEAKDNRLAGTGMEGRMYGSATIVDGKIGGAAKLFGGREYLDLGDMTNTCLGDLDLCEYGVYVSFWVSFGRLSSGGKSVFSSPSINIIQDGNLLIANAKKIRQSWETVYQGLKVGDWYFVEVSWRPDDGITLYINRQRFGYQPVAIYQPPEARTSNNIYVGRDRAGGSGSLSATLDDLDIYYADRQTLININFIQRERPTNHYFDMDTISGNRLVHESMVVTLFGRPRTVQGKIGRAIELDGVSDVVDFGERSTDCFGNLDLCPHGMLVSMWLMPEQLTNNSHYVSTGHNGLSVSYRDKKLHVSAATSTKTWELSTSNFSPRTWQFVELSFHPEKGIRLYQGGRLVAESGQAQSRTESAPANGLDHFFLGRGNVDMRANRYGGGVYDELDLWYADRDYLISHGFIQRSRPEYILVPFEESLDQTQVLHETLNIRLIGRPLLVPGKVGNALELKGRGQYADLGTLADTCMGNLGKCPQGITISAWMKFRSFENNMVFLSTGRRGILMLYKDGYILVSSGGRDVVDTRRFDTDRWYYVEISWHPDHGLRLYVDNELVAQAARDSVSSGVFGDGGNFYIGRPNDGDISSGSYTTGNFDIDELEVWNARREDLLAWNYIQRDSPGYEIFNMDSARGDRIDHNKYNVQLVNGARLGPGHLGQAAVLSGRGQYIDLGPHFNSCMGNLDLCLHGLTVSLWLKPTSLRDNMHFLTTPTYSLFYEDDELHAVFEGRNRTWTVSTPNFHTGTWQRVTLTWHARKGLTLYINDEVASISSGEPSPPSDQPDSDRVYLGRNLVDARLTAETQVDELQLWYDYLDQLRATLKYTVVVTPRIITFDNFIGEDIQIHNRLIRPRGGVGIISGLARDSRAVYLNGRTQYLDMGDNFTCNGNLDTCRQGITFRMAVKPEQLVDGMYLFDSFPVRVYYKDGRMYAEFQTANRVWTVDTSNIQPGLWSRVELAWHPTLGLSMYVNGERVDYETYPRERAPVYNTEWRTYFGRPLNVLDGKYANVALDNFEFYNAYRNYPGIPEDAYLQILQGQEQTVTDRPIPPSWVTDVTTLPVDPTAIIRLNGYQYMKFDLNGLEPNYFVPAQEESFSFYFLTNKANGLIWQQENRQRKMYMYMKDGYLVFVHDNKQGQPEQVIIGRGQYRFDDFKWYKVLISKSGRTITISVGDGPRVAHTFSEDVQFVAPGMMVWLGGTDNTFVETGGSIKENFDGGLASVLYSKYSRIGNTINSYEVNLIGRDHNGIMVDISTIRPPLRPSTTRPPSPRPPSPRPPSPRPPTTPRPTTPPLPKTTSVTFLKRGAHISMPGFKMRSGSSISFRFQTINENGLLLYAGADPQREYLAVELSDGRLYFINNFGRRNLRTAFSQKQTFADGQSHEVEIRFYDFHVDLRVDDIRGKIPLESGERLPANLNIVNVAGFYNYKLLPWMIWSRESFMGCIKDLYLDNLLVDFEPYMRTLVGMVDRQCQTSPQTCAQNRPCVNGVCRNIWLDSICDCSNTEYRGSTCSLDAWTALFNGSVSYLIDSFPTQETHIDNWSLRFKSPLKDALLFQTFAHNSDLFLRCSIEDGKVKVETNLGGELKTLYTGNDVNDFQWHTLYIQRRGNEMKVWLDNDPETKANTTLAGQGYYFKMDKMHLGSVDNSDKQYIGYLQNFYLNDLDILGQIQGSNPGIGTLVTLPPLLYYPVTFPQFNSFLKLPPLHIPLNMVLHFMFKTQEPTGILLLSHGLNEDYLVVELFEGKLYIQFNTGSERPLQISAQQKVNDDQWHAVTIRRTADAHRQYQLTVDGVTSSVTYAGYDGLDLRGPLYIGGAPEELLQKESIRNGIFSRNGFRGCLASVDLTGQVPDLMSYATQQNVKIYDSCTEIQSACTADSCRHFGECVESGAGTFTCNCAMSAHSGTTCLDEPLGYKYQNRNYTGLLIYTYPQLPTSQREEIAFGIMTKQTDAVLLRLFSESLKDFIEFKLVNGYVVVDYDTNGAGGIQSAVQYQKRVNDGQYHIIRFIRGPDGGSLFIDDLNGVSSGGGVVHGSFDRLSKIYVGGNYIDEKIVNAYDGIIGGLSVNGHLIFHDASEKVNTQFLGDVIQAPRPYTLDKIPTDIVTIPTPTRLPPTPPPPVPGTIVPILPPGIGGGGVGWVPGTSGIDTVVVYPGGSSGTVVQVPGPSAAATGGQIAAAQVAAVPTLPGSGPRAGAVMGTILGLMALASSLMWAFYRCKPGWSTCLRPAAEAPMNISAPRATPTNKPLLASVSASGGSGMGGAGGAAGSGGVVVAGSGMGSAGSGKGGGAGGTSFTNYYLSQSSASAGGAGGAGAGGAGAGSGGGEMFDTATLRATGTFSNKGTSIGTPKPARAHLGSTASAVSGSGYSGTFRETTHVRSASGSANDAVGLSPASLQSYHYEGGSSTADYDMATGVHSNYQTNTLTAGGSSLGGSSVGGGVGGFSANTMSSSYNYSVKTVRTVSGQQQMIGYAGTPHIGVPPGALGEEVRVDCCLMTNDGRSVVTGSSLGPPQVWDMQSGELLRIMRGETVGSTNLHLACNDRLLVGAINADLEVNHSSVPKGVHNYLLQIWDFTSGRALEMADHEVCSALSLMSDNDKVVFARSDKFGGGTNVVVWDLLGNQPIKHMRYDAPIGNNDYVHYLALSQNDRYVITGFTNSFDNFAEFVVFDMALTSYTIGDPAILRLDANPECSAVLPRDEAVTGLRNGDLVVWSLRTGQPSRQLLSGSGRHAHAREVKAVARSEDSKYLVSASADHTLKVWDADTEQHINTLNGHTDEVWCCAISPDNEIIVSGSRDKTIRLWRLKSGSEICSFNAGVDIFHVTMSRDKSTIVALGDKLGARKLIMLQVVRTKVRRQISS